jgi:Domain of unknown function (DUF4281)
MPQWIPKLAGISQLFSRHATAASLWVHLLAINMFAARWIMFDGAQLPAYSRTHFGCAELSDERIKQHGITTVPV